VTLAALCAFDIVAYILLLRVLNRHFEKERMLNERRQMTKIFTVFLFFVILQSVGRITLGFWWHLICNNATRDALANLAPLLWDFPCILTICYYQHKSYKVKEASQEANKKILLEDEGDPSLSANTTNKSVEESM